MNSMPTILLLATCLLGGGEALSAESAAMVAANPIRKVVTMMQKMGQKLEEEAKAEADLYEKFECYCKKTKSELETEISKAESRAPITPEDIEAKKNEILRIEDEVKHLKGEKSDDENSLRAARENRKKEHETYEHVVAEEKKTEEAAEGALKALGVSTSEAPSFLQEKSESGFGAGLGAPWMSRLLKAFSRKNSKLLPEQQDKVSAFLQGRSDASPNDAGDVAGYIEEIEKESEDQIVEENKEEDVEKSDYKQVKLSKKDEISALLNQLERKMQAIGTLRVEIVNMEHDMADGAEALAENKKMLAEVTKTCADKAAAWEERKQYRADEQLALADAIKMLNSDDALELFKKTIKNPAFLQLTAGRRQALQKVKAIVDELRVKKHHKSTALNFLALTLSGKKVDFSSVFKRIDEMVALMKKEQADDDSKKDYCNAEFEGSAEKIKGINKKITDLAADIAKGKEGIAKLEEEIAVTQAGVKDLDASVAEATANRQAEHVEYEDLVAGNTAAVELIGMAKNRLNKFYNPSLYSDTTTTTVDPNDPYAFVQVKVAEEREDKDPPPTFEGGYKAKEESNSIIKMMDTLINDLEKEITVAQVDEQHAQKEYEETVADAKEKRAADLKSAATKEQAKNDITADLNTAQEDSQARNTELAETKKYVSDLHAECDWLLQNFDLRKEGRVEETESMTRAKAVLAGADFGF